MSTIPLPHSNADALNETMGLLMEYPEFLEADDDAFVDALHTAWSDDATPAEWARETARLLGW